MKRCVLIALCIPLFACSDEAGNTTQNNHNDAGWDLGNQTDTGMTDDAGMADVGADTGTEDLVAPEGRYLCAAGGTSSNGSYTVVQCLSPQSGGVSTSNGRFKVVSGGFQVVHGN